MVMNGATRMAAGSRGEALLHGLFRLAAVLDAPSLKCPRISRMSR
jgi:hypothetical protein